MHLPYGSGKRLKRRAPGAIAIILSQPGNFGGGRLKRCVPEYVKKPITVTGAGRFSSVYMMTALLSLTSYDDSIRIEKRTQKPARGRLRALHRRKKKMMKRIAAVFLASVLALSMPGCASGKSKTQEPAPAKETTVEAGTGEAVKAAGEKSGKAGTETGAVNATAEKAAGQKTGGTAADTEKAVDVTDLLGTGELEKYKGQKIAIRNVTSVDTEDPGGDLLRFLYGTDGNGFPGDDLYFSVEKDGQTYLMVVKSDEYGVEDGAYQAVEALEEDDVIDLEGYMDTEGEPVARITNVTVH